MHRKVKFTKTGGKIMCTGRLSLLKLKVKSCTPEVKSPKTGGKIKCTGRLSLLKLEVKSCTPEG